jgi:hypothetical protein
MMSRSAAEDKWPVCLKGKGYKSILGEQGQGRYEGKLGEAMAL